MGCMDKQSEMVLDYCGITNSLATKGIIFTFHSRHNLLCGLRFRALYISDSTSRNRGDADMGRLDKTSEMVFNNSRRSDWYNVSDSVFYNTPYPYHIFPHIVGRP